MHGEQRRERERERKRKRERCLHSYLPVRLSHVNHVVLWVATHTHTYAYHCTQCNILNLVCECKLWYVLSCYGWIYMPLFYLSFLYLFPSMCYCCVNTCILSLSLSLSLLAPGMVWLMSTMLRRSTGLLRRMQEELSVSTNAAPYPAHSLHWLANAQIPLTV